MRHSPTKLYATATSEPYNEMPTEHVSADARVHDLAYALASHRAKDVDRTPKNKWKTGNGESDKEPLVTYSLHFAPRRIACA